MLHENLSAFLSISVKTATTVESNENDLYEINQIISRNHSLNLFSHLKMDCVDVERHLAFDATTTSVQTQVAQFLQQEMSRYRMFPLISQRALELFDWLSY